MILRVKSFCDSWDRQPFVSKFGAAGAGVATARMLPRNISQNFLVANYGGSNGAIDNDDESLRWHMSIDWA